MVEFGINSLNLDLDFGDIPSHSRPCLVFLGDLFEYDAQHIRIKNMFVGIFIILDFFSENYTIENFVINKAMTHTITFTATEKLIKMRTNKVIYDQV